jgi:hypothetical protein
VPAFPRLETGAWLERAAPARIESLRDLLNR